MAEWKKWLFQPFRYIAGTRALVIGWLFMLISAGIAALSHTHFDGVLDVHVGWHAPLWIYPVEALVNWSCTVALFYIAGRILSRSAVRGIDIAGTVAYARMPMLFAAVAGFFIVPQGNEAGIPDISSGLIITGIIMLLFTLWMVTLLYQAFTISFNLKGGKAVAGFIIALLAAEIISKILHHQLYLISS